MGHTEIGRANLRIVEKLLTGARHGYPPCFKHIGTVGNRQPIFAICSTRRIVMPALRNDTIIAKIS